MDKKDDKGKKNNKWILFGILILLLILIIYFKNKKGNRLNTISFSEALKKSKLKKIASKYT